MISTIAKVSGLVVRLKPRPWESYAWFLFRTAVANHYSVIRNVAQEAVPRGINVQSLNDHEASDSVHKAFANAVIHPKVDGTHMFTNQFDDLLFGQEPTRRDKRAHYYLWHPKYCPQCIRNGGYHHIDHDVALVTVCLTHRCFLVDCCPACQKKVTIERLFHDKCRCGFVFSKHEPVKVVDKTIISAQEVIQGLLRREFYDVTTNFGEAITAREYFKRLHAMSSLVHGFSGEHPISTITDLRVDKLNYLLTRKERNIQMTALVSAIAHELVTDASYYFPQILPEIDRLTRNGRCPQKKAYLDSLLYLENTNMYEGLYAQYLAQQPEIYVNRRRFRKKIEICKQYLGIRETMEFLGVRHSTVVALCDRSELVYYKTGEGASAVIQVEKASAERWLASRSEWLSTSKVAEKLGLTWKHVNKLALAGVLKAVQVPKKKTASGQWKFSKGVVDELLFHVLGHANQVKNFPEKWVSLPNVLRNNRYRRIGICGIVTAVRDGNVRCCIRDFSDGFGGLYFSHSALDSLMNH